MANFVTESVAYSLYFAVKPKLNKKEIVSKALSSLGDDFKSQPTAAFKSDPPIMYLVSQSKNMSILMDYKLIMVIDRSPGKRETQDAHKVGKILSRILTEVNLAEGYEALNISAVGFYFPVSTTEGEEISKEAVRKLLAHIIRIKSRGEILDAQITISRKVDFGNRELSYSASRNQDTGIHTLRIEAYHHIAPSERMNVDEIVSYVDNSEALSDLQYGKVALDELSK